MGKVAVFVVALGLAAPTAAAEAGIVQDRMVAYAIAEAKRNVREVPARSNTGRRIRRYHTAVEHARWNEAWCTIFVSYIARRAGYPLGSVAQGTWSVETLSKWGRAERFYFRKGRRKVKPGDIALHGYGHAGIVVKVTRKGRIYTVDGNWGDSVRYQPLPYLSVSGYIRLPSEPRVG